MMVLVYVKLDFMEADVILNVPNVTLTTFIIALAPPMMLVLVYQDSVLMMDVMLINAQIVSSI